MKITDVGDAVPVVGSNGADDLCEKVWGARGPFIAEYEWK
jgi:hypothetical protein